MFIVIGWMLSGIGVGYLFRRKKLVWIHQVILVLIWLLLFLLGAGVGGNATLINGLSSIGFQALLITFGAVAGSILASWGLWWYIGKTDKGNRS